LPLDEASIWRSKLVFDALIARNARALAQLVVQQMKFFIRKAQTFRQRITRQIDHAPPGELVRKHIQQVFDVRIRQRNRAVLVDDDDAFRQMLKNSPELIVLQIQFLLKTL
jgi:ribosomal protein L30/L7E